MVHEVLMKLKGTSFEFFMVFTESSNLETKFQAFVTVRLCENFHQFGF